MSRRSAIRTEAISPRRSSRSSVLREILKSTAASVIDTSSGVRPFASVTATTEYRREASDFPYGRLSGLLPRCRVGGSDDEPIGAVMDELACHSLLLPFDAKKYAKK
jgi:hypothetical protein